MTASLLQRSFFAIRYPSVERDLASEGPKNDSFRVGCSLEIAFSDRIMAPWRNERRGPLSLSRFGCSFKRIIASRAGASISGPEFQASDRLWLISNIDNLVHYLLKRQPQYLGWPYICGLRSGMHCSRRTTSAGTIWLVFTPETPVCSQICLARRDVRSVTH